jgi:hypothetical protein
MYWSDLSLVYYTCRFKCEMYSFHLLCSLCSVFIDNHLNWKNRIDQIIPKLNAACYMVSQLYCICSNDTLRSIYFACFHSIASYGIILGRNSSYSKKIFTLQKRITRIMVGAHPRTSCRRLFKKLDILTVPSQYRYSLMSFFIGN